MDDNDVVSTLVALGQITRLQTFRLLVKAGPAGLPAGDLASALGVPRNTMSSHFGILSRAELITSKRMGRHIYYSVNLAKLADLTAFLVAGCCGGRRDLCDPLIQMIKGIEKATSPTS